MDLLGYRVKDFSRRHPARDERRYAPEAGLLVGKLREPPGIKRVNGGPSPFRPHSTSKANTGQHGPANAPSRHGSWGEATQVGDVDLVADQTREHGPWTAPGLDDTLVDQGVLETRGHSIERRAGGPVDNRERWPGVPVGLARALLGL